MHIIIICPVDERLLHPLTSSWIRKSTQWEVHGRLLAFHAQSTAPWAETSYKE